MSERPNLPERFESVVDRLCETTRLSPTRAKVLALIKLHNDRDDIADILNISRNTVQNHIQDLRKEIDSAEEIVDIAGAAHYGDDTLYKEFGGALWVFRSGMRYQKNKNTHVEKKIYGSPYGSCLMVEREISEKEGRIRETRERTEFYDGNDVPRSLYHKGKFDSFEVAELHVAFIENAGIDPVYSPSDLCSADADRDEFESVKENNGWIEL